MLVRSDSRSVVSYINNQGGLISKQLHAGEWPSCVGSEQSAFTEGDTCAEQVEPWSRLVVKEQRLLRGMDAPPAHGSVREVYGRARVDLFTSEDNSHCQKKFTKSTDALAHEWPSLPLYGFPPIALLPQVLRRVREQRHKLILIAPL